MEVYREFVETVKSMYDKHMEKATEYMDETQKEIYKIGFDNAIEFAKTFIVEADVVFNDVEL